MSSRGRSPRKTGKRCGPALEGPDYRSTPLGLTRFGKPFSFRRLKPAATHGRPLRGLRHGAPNDFDPMLSCRVTRSAAGDRQRTTDNGQRTTDN
jgi:hypothetical protein